MITDVIDDGGGLNSSYAVGIFNYCMVHDIHFDLGIEALQAVQPWRPLQLAKEDEIIILYRSGIAPLAQLYPELHDACIRVSPPHIQD